MELATLTNGNLVTVHSFSLNLTGAWIKVAPHVYESFSFFYPTSGVLIFTQKKIFFIHNVWILTLWFWKSVWACKLAKQVVTHLIFDVLKKVLKIFSSIFVVLMHLLRKYFMKIYLVLWKYLILCMDVLSIKLFKNG